jgi:hypothetical protein
MRLGNAQIAFVQKGSGLVELEACQRLAAIAGQVDVRHAIVEVGSYRGRSAGWLALGAQEGCGAHVTAIDPWDKVTLDGLDDDYQNVEPAYVDGRYKNAYTEFENHCTHARLWGRVTPLQATALEAVKVWKQPIGLFFHDAVHTADGIEADLREWAPFVVPGGWIAAHDIGQPAYGVEEGAARVLDNDDWDWAGRERLLYRKDPNRRGLMVVERLR